MDFEDEYLTFMESHIQTTTGFANERLRTHHGYAEKLFLKNVWWPAFQHFDGLHPEYEVHDYRDGFRYIDFAYLHDNFRIAIEIDGLGPHWRNITRSQFCEQYQRQNQLVIDGWYILRFGYDDVNERPRLCQQAVEQLMGRLLGYVSTRVRNLGIMEREVLLLAIRNGHPITPKQVANLLHVSTDSAIKYLQNLCASSWLQPASGTRRIRSYRIHPSRKNVQL